MIFNMFMECFKLFWKMLMPWCYTIKMVYNIEHLGKSLAVQLLGLGVFIAVGPGSIPGRGTKIPQAMQRGQKKKKMSSLF